MTTLAYALLGAVSGIIGSSVATFVLRRRRPSSVYVYKYAKYYKERVEWVNGQPFVKEYAGLVPLGTVTWLPVDGVIAEDYKPDETLDDVISKPKQCWPTLKTMNSVLIDALVTSFESIIFENTDVVQLYKATLKAQPDVEYRYLDIYFDGRITAWADDGASPESRWTFEVAVKVKAEQQETA